MALHLTRPVLCSGGQPEAFLSPWLNQTQTLKKMVFRFQVAYSAFLEMWARYVDSR